MRRFFVVAMLLVAVFLVVSQSHAGWLFGRRGGGCPGGKCPVAPNYRKPSDPQPVKPRPYVTRVVCGGSAGSGVMVEWNGQPYVLSAWHVFGSGGKRAKFKSPSGTYESASVIATSKAYDLALLKPDDPAGLVTTPLSYARPVDGQELVRAGCGHGDYYQERRGKWLRPQRPYSKNGGTELEWGSMSASARSGDSGCPILDKNGWCVGILHHGNASVTVFTVAARVRKFLREHLGPEEVKQEQVAESDPNVPFEPPAFPSFIPHIELPPDPDPYVRDSPPPSGKGYTVDLPDISTTDPSILESLGKDKKPVISPIPDGVKKLLKDATTTHNHDGGSVAGTSVLPSPQQSEGEGAGMDVKDDTIPAVPRFLDPEPMPDGKEQENKRGSGWPLVLLIAGACVVAYYWK